MKILKVVIILSFIYVFTATLVFAEIIFTKDGQTIHAKITEKTEDTIWYEVERGEIIEEIGIDISEVDRILNDDGSISEYSPR